MTNEVEFHVKFEESGGGWGNPLMGKVFDSKIDLSKEQVKEFLSLLEVCDLSQDSLISKNSTTDLAMFQLTIINNDKENFVSGTFLEMDTSIKELVRFLRKHGRQKLLD